jgi:hypothetical protein
VRRTGHHDVRQTAGAHGLFQFAQGDKFGMIVKGFLHFCFRRKKSAGIA